MKFSFIIPVYNVRQYLEQCVDSILNQSNQDYEIILVDDGSTDGADVICDEYARKHFNVKCLHQSNAGQSRARNCGIENANGEYLIFLDSDDLWIDEKSLEAISCDCAAVDCVAFGWTKFKNESEIQTDMDFPLPKIGTEIISGSDFLNNVLKHKKTFPWYVWCYCFRTEWWKKNGFCFPEGIKYEDVSLTYQLLYSAKSMRVFAKTVYGYRVEREDSTTQQICVPHLKDHLNVSAENMQSIKKNSSMEKGLKEKLLDNFSCSYYSVAICVNLLTKKDDRKKILLLLKQKQWVCTYTMRKPQKLVAYAMKLLGIKWTVKLLNLRRKGKQKNGL